MTINANSLQSLRLLSKPIRLSSLQVCCRRSSDTFPKCNLHDRSWGLHHRHPCSNSHIASSRSISLVDGFTSRNAWKGASAVSIDTCEFASPGISAQNETLQGDWRRRKRVACRHKIMRILSAWAIAMRTCHPLEGSCSIS